jgi:hypothetical protein
MYPIFIFAHYYCDKILLINVAISPYFVAYTHSATRVSAVCLLYKS